MRRGQIDTNPARYLELPPAPRPKAVVWTQARVAHWPATGEHPTIAVWTAHQTAQFLHHIRQHRLYPLFRLITLVGLRRGEACALRWSMLGHSSIVLTADTYTSVLPDLAHHAAEATTRLILKSAGTTSRTIRNGQCGSHHRRPTKRSPPSPSRYGDQHGAPSIDHWTSDPSTSTQAQETAGPTTRLKRRRAMYA